MSDFCLTTDTSCDVFRNELDEKQIPWIPLSFTIDGVTYDDDFSSDDRYADFYDKIKSGAMPTTSQINVFNHEEFFEKVIANGAKNIIHLTLSGGLSNTVNSARTAAQNVTEKHHDCKIYILDTFSATQGHRYVLDEAVKLRDGGVSVQDAYNELETLASKVHHWIVVDDLMHLKRGGRVSGASAYIGSLLNIKPVLIINSEGKLAVVKKAKGTLKAYQYVMEMIKEHAEDLDNLVIYLADADANDKVEEMKKLIKEAYPAADVRVGWIGPVIGAHTGSGTLGIVFKGKKRLDNK